MRGLFFGQVKDMETHLLRLQSDLRKCVSLIQDPRKLKSSLQTIYARYVSQPDQVSTSCFKNFRAGFMSFKVSFANYVKMCLI